MKRVRVTSSACLILSIGMMQNLYAADAAPDNEYQRLQEMMQKSVPGQELVDTLYTFMEKWPKDPRGDQVQFWVGQTQQKRKFHNEAIKEFNFVITDFPKSPLLPQAYRAKAASFMAIDKQDQAADCFGQIVTLKPRDFNANQEHTSLFREACIWLAERAMRQKDPKVDEAVGLLMQLPDQKEAVTRVVEIYVSVQRFDEALATIERLPASDRLLGYELLCKLYAARPGTANLRTLLGKLFEVNPPADAVDRLVQHVVGLIGQKDQSERHASLELVSQKYDRLRRWADMQLCEMDRGSDVDRLIRFVGDYRTGGDVEQCKQWTGEFYESAGAPEKAREAYWKLNNTPAAHFLVAETYYGGRAKKPDLEGGEKELTEIVKRFYSPAVSCDALNRRADLQAGRMNKTDAAIATLRELVDRFPEEGDWASRSLMKIAQLLRGQKKYDDAIIAYETVILRYEKSGVMRPAWMEIAETYIQKEEPKRAIETYKTVLRKFPRTHEASQAHTILETKFKIADTDVSDR